MLQDEVSKADSKSGLPMFPTQKRIYGDDGGGHQIPNPVLISIDISEMEFVEG